MAEAGERGQTAKLTSSHMCAPPARQQKVCLPLRSISTGLPTAVAGSTTSLSRITASRRRRLDQS